MANQLILPVNPATLPNGWCPTTYQEMLNTFSANQSVIFPSTFVGITASSTKPSDTTKGWLQLDSLGRPTRLYYFAQGAWLSQHPLPPGFSMIWTSALPDFTTFDGGDANGIGPASGPMWQEIETARYRFPVGAGTLPSGPVLAVGDQGGSEQGFTLDVTNLPPHTHPIKGTDANQAGGQPNELPSGEHRANTQTFQTDAAGGTAGAAVKVNLGLPLYLVVYFLKRTNRSFYAVT